MSRLNFVIAFNQPTVADNDGSITLTILANSSGTLQARVYLDGGGAPAFANITNPQVYSGLSSGTWRVEFKDNNGERLLAKIVLDVPLDACGEDVGEIAVLADRVRIQLDDAGFFFGSVNGGANWKKIIGTPNRAEWTNSELAALGLVGPTIPTAKIRTETDPGLPPSDSELFGVGSSPANACADAGGSPITCYWSPGTWGPGTVLYTDAALTTRLTGFAYVTPVNAIGGVGAGDIYNLNSANGVVGSYTGVSC